MKTGTFALLGVAALAVLCAGLTGCSHEAAPAQTATVSPAVETMPGGRGQTTDEPGEIR